MTTVVRRDFRSVPYRDAFATWAAIVDLLTAGSNDTTKQRELLSVAGVASSVIADHTPGESPIVVVCEGPRTRIYCIYDVEAIDDSSSNEAALGFDALNGDWQVSLPVAKDDLEWVGAALMKKSTRIVARDKDLGIEFDNEAEAVAVGTLSLDIEEFMKS